MDKSRSTVTKSIKIKIADVTNQDNNRYNLTVYLCFSIIAMPIFYNWVVKVLEKLPAVFVTSSCPDP